MTPKISFIVPVYKVEKYINQCVDSILAQTFTDFEIILIDDGSPDNCPQICDEYALKDERVHVIHRKNGGVSSARNMGIEAAKGEWAYFVDSDDWIEPNAAEILLKKAIETHADCVISDPLVQYSNRTVRGYMFSKEFTTQDRSIIEGVQKFMLCHKYNPFYTKKTTVGVAAPWCKFSKMSIIKENKVYFDPYAMGRFDDGIWTLYLLDKVNTLSYLPEATYNYRITGSSICYAFKPNALEILGHGFELTELFIKNTSKDYSFTEAHYGRVCRYFALYLSQYFYSKDNPKTESEIAKEIKDTLKSEPYYTAIRKVDMSKLDNKHKVVVLMARAQFIPGLKLYTKLKALKS